MDQPKISVSVSHSLGVEEALRRVQAMPNTDPEVQMLDLNMHLQPHKQADISLKLSVHKVNVAANIQVTPTLVTLTSAPFPWYATPFIWYANRTLRTTLEATLK